VKSSILSIFPRYLSIAVCFCIVILLAWPARSATTNSPPPATTVGVTNQPAAKAPSTDEDDSSSDENGKHSSAKLEFHTDPGDSWIVDLIPLAGIAATFGTPVLIICALLYFKYRRRQENLAMVREFLSKGQPVPPELLVDSSNWKYAYGASQLQGSARCDLNRGFKLTFIGLGIMAALFVSEPHSTNWGWGLIPMVMGIGYLLSAWVQRRDQPVAKDAPLDRPPGSTPWS
jgi:hypothetical protein